jgi:hypothetical protein
VAADSANMALTFTVDNFLNPYNTRPRYGYWIATTNGEGKMIDMWPPAYTTPSGVSGSTNYTNTSSSSNTTAY